MIPVPSDPNTLVSVVGIDPGSETLGVGIVTFDIFTGVVASCEAYTFKGSKLHGNEFMGSITTERLGKIQNHSENLYAIFERVQPIAVASESPFMNVKRPSAYGALTEVVCAIRAALLRYDKWRPLYMVPPSLAKNAVGASGGADKEAVKAAMLKCPDLVDTCLMDITLLDEHSVDGLAVAYYQKKSIMESRFQPLL